MNNSILEATNHHAYKLAEAMLPASFLFITFAAAKMASVGEWLFTPSASMVIVWLLVTDLATGLIKANVYKTVNSSAGFKGAVKIALYLAILGLVILASSANPIVAGFLQVLLFAIIYTELISNFENIKSVADYYGISIPLLDLAVKYLNIKMASMIKDVEEAVDTPTEDKPEDKQLRLDLEIKELPND